MVAQLAVVGHYQSPTNDCYREGWDLMPGSLITQRRPRLLPGILLLACLASSAQEPARFTYKPPGGYVPDGATAIKIAVAVWEPIYGCGQIASEAPYSAKLKNGVWLVEGHLPEGSDGGVAEVEISKESGEILRLSHGK